MRRLETITKSDNIYIYIDFNSFSTIQVLPVKNVFYKQLIQDGKLTKTEIVSNFKLHRL